MRWAKPGVLVIAIDNNIMRGATIYLLLCMCTKRDKQDRMANIFFMADLFGDD
jgi:hypothetical protein